MSQVQVSRQLSHVDSPVWNGRDLDLRVQIDANPRQLDTSLALENRHVQFQQSTAPSSSDSVLPNDTTNLDTSLPFQVLQHQRIRALHGDHQPLYIAPPPPHFFPAFPQLTTPLRAQPLVRSVSAVELSTPPSARTLAQSKLTSLSTLQAAAPVLASSLNVNGVTPKGKRGRKPKDPIAHAAKKEARERKRLEKEASEMALNQSVPPTTSVRIGLPRGVVEEVASESEMSSRPSTSGGLSSSGMERANTPPISFPQGTKKRTADSAFGGGVAEVSTTATTSWLAAEEGSSNMDVESWATPLSSPITSPENGGGLGIFLQAPPSTPIDEILSSSARLGINPALLFQEESLLPSMKLGKTIRALKSPMEILDEYPLRPQSPSPLATSSRRPSTPSEDSSKKIGLMDLMLLNNRPSESSDDKPSPRKKLRPDLVFSTTKRGKAIVSLQKTSPTESIEPPTTPIREPSSARVQETPNTDDLRSLVLKRRQEVWGDEVGTEVTRITVHRRLTSRKTSAGLMSPLSPKSSAKRSTEETLMDSDSDSDDSTSSSSSSDSDEESDSETAQHEIITIAQVTPLATPTNPLLAGQSMQKSFSAPGLFQLNSLSHGAKVSQDLFLPSTPPHQITEEDDLLLPSTLLSRADPTPLNLDDDSSMRCKTCGMLFRKQAGLTSHERTCMVKQTPFIPYDFLRDDGFSTFGGARQLFHEDPFNPPVIRALAMESPLVARGDGKRFNVFVAPRDTLSSSSEEDEGGSGTTKSVGAELRGKLKNNRVIGEARGQTRCICNKSEKAVSGVMVQCGKCEYWLHTKCLKVKARDLPDEWYCPACVEEQ